MADLGATILHYGAVKSGVKLLLPFQKLDPARPRMSASDAVDGSQPKESRCQIGDYFDPQGYVSCP